MRAALRIGEHGAIVVRRKPDGKFVAQCNRRDEDGVRRRKSSSGDTPEVARARLRARLAAMNFAGIGDESPFRDLAAYWFDNREWHLFALGTKAHVASLMSRTIMKSPLAMTPIEDVRTSTVAQFYRSLLERPATAKNSLSLLRLICDVGVEQDFWATNPARNFKPERSRRNRRPDVPASSELMGLRAAALAYREAPRNGPQPSMLLLDVLDVMLGTGLRVGEAVGLRLIDVDLETEPPLVDVNGTVVERAGVPKFYQQFPKTINAFRRIPLPAYAARALRERVARGDTGHTYIFETRSGRPNGPQDVHRALRLVRDWANMSENLSPHAIRRFVATTVYEAQGLGAASQTLGHRESSVTERHYVNRNPLAPDARTALERALTTLE